MNPIQIFKIETQKTAFHPASVYIEENVLAPPSHFSPEDKKAIAAIHAEHIQQYASRGFILPLIIILNIALDDTYSKGSLLSKVTPFTKENGGHLKIQTLFSPLGCRQPPSTEMRLIRLTGATYE